MATNQAGPVALLSGDADVIVSDWTWALRQRALGEHLKFAPYSSALGARDGAEGHRRSSQLADLKGKKLGVAGGAIDKSWLLLRAYSRKTLGTDIADLAEPVFGAAPLLTEEMRSGPPRRGAQLLDLCGAPRRRRLPHSSSAWTRS